MQAVRTWALLSALALFSFGAHATTFDFESLTPPIATGTSVPDGYGGATWTGLLLRRSNELQGAGFVIDGTTMAFGVDVAPTITFAAPTVYGGAYIGNSAVAGTSVSYDLYLGPDLMASSGAIGFNASFMASVYGGAIDKIVFHVAANGRFSLDDFSASAAVPELQTGALLLAGLALVAGRLRQRQR